MRWPQRFQIQRFDVRRALNDWRSCCATAPKCETSHEIVARRAGEAELWCEADEGQIKQIIWNLATNGLRAMPNGGRAPSDGAIEPASDGVTDGQRTRGSAFPPRAGRPLSAVSTAGLPRAAASTQPSSIASSPTTTARFA